MASTIIYFAILTAIVYGIWFMYTNYMNKKQKELIQDMDLNTELNQSKNYLSKRIDSEFSYIKERMAGKAIDAFSYATVRYTTEDSIKTGIKDGLKGMATLGTVRFTTVRTPKYLILSGDDLHLFDTDKNGNISEHFLFDSEKLTSSSLEEIPLYGTSKAYVNGSDGKIKLFKISLTTENKPIELEFLSALIFNDATIASGNIGLGNQAKHKLEGMIIVNGFLKQLGEKYPNLKVDLPILN